MTVPFTRREALGVALAATLGGAATGAAANAAGATVAPLPLSPSAGPGPDGLQRFMRMRLGGRLGPVLWVYSGVLMVKPEGQVARPLVRIDGVSYTAAQPRADGSFDWELEEIGFYGDLQTGKVLERAINPFTGAEMRPVPYRSPQKLRFTPDGILPEQKMPPGGEFRGDITTLAQVGGTLAMTEDLYVRMPGRPAREGQPARPDRMFASLATFTSSVAQLERPAGDWVDCVFSYSTMNSLAGWLGMEGVAGIQSMRLVGEKRRENDLAAMPRWLRERIAVDYPGYLRN